jgi:cytochrome c-type biogenesis protein CcmE
VTDGTALPPMPRRRATLGSRRRLMVAVVVVLAALGTLLYQGLSNAATYFYTADQAVAHKHDQGTRRFRIEGAVVAGSVHQTGPTGTGPAGTAVAFQIANNGVTVDVVHAGGQPELFQDNIPVVLEGHWAGARFASDNIMVKHSATYRQLNPTRVKNYNS